MKTFNIASFLLIFFIAGFNVSAQTGNLYPIEFQKRKLMYQGNQIGKAGTKKLKNILKEANDPKVNRLFKSYRGIQYLSLIPTATGIGYFIAGVAKLGEDNTLGELTQSQQLLSTGVSLTLAGLIINLVSWPLTGKKAVIRYNEVVDTQNSLSAVSVKLRPATKGLGLGLSIEF